MSSLIDALVCGPTGDYNQFPGERLNGRVSASAKSRVKANVNIANQGLLDEQEHHLSYVLRIRNVADISGTGSSDEDDPVDDDTEDQRRDGPRGYGAKDHVSKIRKNALANSIRELLESKRQPNDINLNLNEASGGRDASRHRHRWTTPEAPHP